MKDEALTTKEHTETHGDKIKSYRKLSYAEIDLINEVKAAGVKLGVLVERVEKLDSSHKSPRETTENDVFIDKRWLALARTDLQVGMMKLVRSIARPEGF